MAKKYDWAITPNKDKHQYVVGIDLGHGETSAAYAEIGWGQDVGTLEPVKDIDLPQDKTYVIPSAIAIDTDGSVHIGADAFEYAQGELHVCFKQRPTNINGTAEQLMIKFMRAVYELIRERVGAILTDNNHIVHIATPSGWDEEAQDLYGQMAKQAGMPIAGVTWESRAAFIKAQSSADSGLPQYVDKGAIVFDMGSSTLDFTYISSEVLQNNRKPIDFGYDCGASNVEKIMYSNLRKDNDTVSEFEMKYPKAVDRLLFEMRKGKEEYFRKDDHKLRQTIDFYQLVNDEDLDIIRNSYTNGQLEEALDQNGYIEKIRKAMIDYKENHIAGKPIYAAFFTGGASRMTFLKDLVEELWGVKYVFRDQNPSLTISQGVAEAARSDSRSGGAGNVKEIIKKLTADIDVYESFALKLGDKLSEEIRNSVYAAIVAFRDDEEDNSLKYLEYYIQGCIKDDVSHISEWSTECMSEAFEEATGEIKDRVQKMVANYSKTDIQMGKLSTDAIEIPELDMSSISEQIQDMASSFTEDVSVWSTVITNGVIGVIGGLIGPIGWVCIGLKLLWDWFSGETEEEKQEKAKFRDLDAEDRQRVFDEFENRWEELCDQINQSIGTALFEDENMSRNFNKQCNKVLKNYADECIRQTRIMLD